MPWKKFTCNSCLKTKKKHLSGCKLTQKSRVLFHQGVDFGMPANWMSYHGHIWCDMKSHNCADRWTKLPWSLLLPRLKKELLIACCSFCSYPLTLCDNLVLMACTPVCTSKMRVATSNMGKTCLLNHPHCTATRELSPRNVWVLLHSKHICLQHKYQFVSRACKAIYRYLSHQAFSLNDDVEDGCPLNASDADEVPTSMWDWRPSDGGWKLHSSSGTDGAETHLQTMKRHWQIINMIELDDKNNCKSYQRDQLWGSQSCHFVSLNSSRMSQRSPKWIGT